jgi:hypothetical protein
MEPTDLNLAGTQLTISKANWTDGKGTILGKFPFQLEPLKNGGPPSRKKLSLYFNVNVELKGKKLA